MIIAFQTKTTDILKRFMNNWESPESPFVQAVNMTYVEFKITYVA
jgi:hypothetical protein